MLISIFSSQLLIFLSDIAFYDNKYISLEDEIKILKNEFSLSNSSNEDISLIVNQINSKEKYIMRDPSYSEALDFVLTDNTNEIKTYDELYYNCVHFSRDVNNHAEKQGIRCAYVEISLNNSLPHAIIAFNTTDAGIIYFEPQTDDIVNLEIGKDYWKYCVNSTFSETQPPGLIVENIKLYW